DLYDALTEEIDDEEACVGVIERGRQGFRSGRWRKRLRRGGRKAGGEGDFLDQLAVEGVVTDRFLSELSLPDAIRANNRMASETRDGNLPEDPRAIRVHLDDGRLSIAAHEFAQFDEQMSRRVVVAQ